MADGRAWSSFAWPRALTQQTVLPSLRTTNSDNRFLSKPFQGWECVPQRRFQNGRWNEHHSVPHAY